MATRPKQDNPSGGDFQPITVGVAPDPRFRPITVGQVAAPVAATKSKPAAGEKER